MPKRCQLLVDCLTDNSISCLPTHAWHSTLTSCQAGIDWGVSRFLLRHRCFMTFPYSHFTHPQHPLAFQNPLTTMYLHLTHFAPPHIGEQHVVPASKDVWDGLQLLPCRRNTHVLHPRIKPQSVSLHSNRHFRYTSKISSCAPFSNSVI